MFKVNNGECLPQSDTQLEGENKVHFQIFKVRFIDDVDN
jgi:hypothetical protein